VYALPNGTQYVGTEPPEGAEYLGVWYPRAATLGGCAAHNALITVTPQDDDWTFVQNVGDGTLHGSTSGHIVTGVNELGA